MKNLLKIHQLSTRFDDVITQWGGTLLSLILRCYVAWQFLHAGLIKIQNWPGTLELFHTEYHVPLLPPDLAAYMGAGGELVLPCFLIAGLFSRPAAIGLFFVNAMAVISYPQLWEFECPAGINDHFYWGIILVVIAVFGAGRFSIDALLKNITAKAV
ncbi:DoxX family protein [Solimicrobium silvestre]|uniref:Putative membrane protein n=1 Tax=Solimicrobium silvestre TaxID=2099400 RepID=A0A2S9H5L5_9BURK|nr:DoxX family protein [Solimicrobium silvestre]PRC95231.1 putative membrane protein [Solimicrobium silvestre]